MNNLDLFLNEIQTIESQITPFNYALYYELYPDLKQQKICTFIALYQHYIKQGKKENRITSYSEFYQQFPGFDYNFYINSNKDLITTIQIKYSSKIEVISEPYKEHFAIVHYFLYGQYQNKLINPNSLLTVNINPNNLPTALSFLNPPQLGNATIANICYQEYLNSNTVIIEPINENVLEESNIGSVLFVDNVFPLNVSYSNELRIINGNLFVKSANINNLSINTIENDLQIFGNLSISGNINSNSIVNQHITTFYNYTNSYVYQDTFSILGNLEVSTELSLNDYKHINFTGEYEVTDTFFSFSTLYFNLIDLDFFTIEFNLKVNDISTETQIVFGCDNFEINLNLFNQIEINYNNEVFSGITQMLPNNNYFITITNNNLFINGNVDITLNLNKINTNNCYLGKNTVVNLLLGNFRISNTIRYTDTFIVVLPFILDKNTIILSEIEDNKLKFIGYSKIFTVNNTGVFTEKCVISELISNTANIKLINNNTLYCNTICVNDIHSNNTISNNITTGNLNTEILFTTHLFSENANLFCGNIDKLSSYSSNILYANINTLNSNNLRVCNITCDTLTTIGNLIITDNNINGLNNLNGNIIFKDNTVYINCDLQISGNTELNTVSINKIESNLYVEKEIFNNYGHLYGNTLLLQWGYFDIPVNSIFNFGLAEPGNDTGYAGAQFSTGFAIQGNPIVNTSARLILRCQDISYNYNGTTGPRTIALAICQLRYQGNTPCTPINSNLATTFIDITEPFLCNTETTKGYFTVVSPFFNLINLDVPTLGLRVISMTNNGTCMRLGPAYLQLK